ncbi:MAG: ribose 5-phosphate isomerase B [Anaerolineae bacterium]|nr:ribose 5-phosphate isomerase B [Anaerolineae bacterium]
MKIVIAADHAGYDLKQSIIAFLNKQNLDVSDLGVDTAAVPADYPDVAERVAQALTSGQADRGVIVCGSGVGVSVAANKFRGIYAGLCHDTYSAHQGVEHDNMNVLCLGARIVGIELAREIVNSFLNASFQKEDRFLRRFNKVRGFEEDQL